MRTTLQTRKSQLPFNQRFTRQDRAHWKAQPTNTTACKPHHLSPRRHRDSATSSTSPAPASLPTVTSSNVSTYSSSSRRSFIRVRDQYPGLPRGITHLEQRISSWASVLTFFLSAGFSGWLKFPERTSESPQSRSAPNTGFRFLVPTSLYVTPRLCGFVEPTQPSICLEQDLSSALAPSAIAWCRLPFRPIHTSQPFDAGLPRT